MVYCEFQLMCFNSMALMEDNRGKETTQSSMLLWCKKQKNTKNQNQKQTNEQKPFCLEVESKDKYAVFLPISMKEKF